MQYLQPSLYALAGKSITNVSVPSTVTTVTAVEIIKFFHNLQLGLQAIIFLLLLKSNKGAEKTHTLVEVLNFLTTL
jgi:hypothetical protein